MTPAARRGLLETITGRFFTLDAPTLSVRTAAAPLLAASDEKSAPWKFSPGNAMKRSPGIISLLD